MGGTRGTLMVDAFLCGVYMSPGPQNPCIVPGMPAVPVEGLGRSLHRIYLAIADMQFRQ